MKLTKLNELLENGKVVKGRWEITPDHQVQYRREGKDEEILVKGSLVAAEPDALVLSVSERQSDQKIITSLVRLSGLWRVNLKNQIAFEVAKKSGSKDLLTFKSGWRVNENHELVYTYKQTNLKTKTKSLQELQFGGTWEISEKNRLVYALGGDTDSTLRFRGSFQTKSIYAKKGEIRYQIGAEVLGKRRLQSIAFFGKWKVSRDLSLEFEMKSGSRKKSILFGGQYRLGSSREIAVNLKSEQGSPLGVELILTRDILSGDGQWFIRLQKSLEESRLEAGVKGRW